MNTVEIPGIGVLPEIGTEWVDRAGDVMTVRGYANLARKIGYGPVGVICTDSEKNAYVKHLEVWFPSMTPISKTEA